MLTPSNLITYSYCTALYLTNLIYCSLMQRSIQVSASSDMLYSNLHGLTEITIQVRLGWHVPTHNWSSNLKSHNIQNFCHSLHLNVLNFHWKMFNYTHFNTCTFASEKSHFWAQHSTSATFGSPLKEIKFTTIHMELHYRKNFSKKSISLCT
jgi:hypothetical protein